VYVASRLEPCRARFVGEPFLGLRLAVEADNLLLLAAKDVYGRETPHAPQLISLGSNITLSAALRTADTYEPLLPLAPAVRPYTFVVVDQPVPATFSTRWTMRRRSVGFLICMNALMSDSPSDVAVNFEMSASECPSPVRFDPFAEVARPSKKKETGTRKKLAMCWSRLALMRLVPFSYFCTCWNVRPSASPSSVWLKLSIKRRIRTRLPTCTSVELADLVTSVLRGIRG